MIFTHNTFDVPNFKAFASLSHQVPDSLLHLSIQHLVAILHYLDKIELNLKQADSTPKCNFCKRI
jgi:hypothetical protein